jgi:hypothetical protein
MGAGKRGRGNPGILLSPSNGFLGIIKTLKSEGNMNTKH